ncbi:MAG: penicillin-binding protein 1A [Candidatus Margulisiibacteriota bacterium]|jgi:penicillin-binding protein 1A
MFKKPRRKYKGRVQYLPQTVGFNYQTKKKRQKKFASFIKKISYLFFSFCLVGALILGIAIFLIAKKLPNVDTISTYIPNETTKIYSIDGIVLADLHQEENRSFIPIEDISPNVIKTVLAVEDTDFYKHHGINLKGIVRATFKNLVLGRFAEGASTITQQLARNLFLNQKRKLSRKLAEVLLAIEIERKYTKIEILELYLNEVYWGHNAYGIESASIMYFGKPAKDLSIAESAMLVGLLKGPELYSPFKNFALSKQRQRTVLQRMKSLGLIDQDTMVNAYNENLVLAPRKRFRYLAPYFTSYIIEQLKKMYGEEALYTGGLKVYTSLNYELQKVAEKVIEKYVDYGNNSVLIKDKVAPKLNYDQAAILALDADTGYIKAMQGGADFGVSQFNRCYQAIRQPGSSFKPIVYFAAINKGFSPNTVISDTPITFHTSQGPYSPKNYDKKYRGSITLRKALEQSINVVAVKLTNMIGPDYVVQTARKLGILSPLYPVLSLPLGANGVNMLEITGAYAVFANGGFEVKPTGIIRIEDRNGEILYQTKLVEKRIFDEDKVNMLNDMLKGVINNGTGKAAKLPRPVAGKTGTTSDYRDAWFIGYVPQLVCAVWVGNDNNTPTRKVSGGTVPAKIWRDFMSVALAGIPPKDFNKPNGIANNSVDLIEEVVKEETTDSQEKSPSANSSKEQPKSQNTEDEEVINFFNKGL